MCIPMSLVLTIVTTGGLLILSASPAYAQSQAEGMRARGLKPTEISDKRQDGKGLMPPSIADCAAEPIRYVGREQPDKRYYDGGLRHAVGVHSYQALRANRRARRKGVPWAGRTTISLIWPTGATGSTCNTSATLWANICLLAGHCS